VRRDMYKLLIGYDLNRPRKADDYPKLIEAIKKLGTWWHHLDSTWIVVSSESASVVVDKLLPFIDSTDELLVVELTGHWSSWGINDSGNAWLKKNIQPTVPMRLRF
jgi:hypothetical protein